MNAIKSEVVSVKCYDCDSSLGGYKHKLLFLGGFTVERKSKHPLNGKVIGKKSKLSKVESQEKFIMASQLITSKNNVTVKRKCTPKGSHLKEVLEHINLKLSQSP